MAASLQHPQTSLGAGLPAASTRYYPAETSHCLGQAHNALDWNTLSHKDWTKISVRSAFGKLYTTKTPITSADLLNDRVLPFFEVESLPLLRILTDRGTEYCGRAERHDYELYLAINDIEHTKTKAKSPQTNCICERFHKTILQEFSLRLLIFSQEDLRRPGITAGGSG